VVKASFIQQNTISIIAAIHYVPYVDEDFRGKKTISNPLQLIIKPNVPIINVHVPIIIITITIIIPP